MRRMAVAVPALELGSRSLRSRENFTWISLPEHVAAYPELFAMADQFDKDLRQLKAVYIL